jgi:hypothetical protein
MHMQSDVDAWAKFDAIGMIISMYGGSYVSYLIFFKVLQQGPRLPTAWRV